MGIKQKIWKIAEWVLIIYMALEATLAGGAHYAAETGKHLHGVAWEEFPSVGLGLVSPLCAALVAFKLLSSWTLLPPYLRTILLLIWIYWFACWIPFIGTYFLAHPQDLSYPEMYKIYFPEDWRLASVIGIFSIVSANTVMLPAMLAAMFGDTIVAQKQQVELDNQAQEKADRELLKQAGQLSKQIVDSLIKDPLGKTRGQLELELDAAGKVYPLLIKLMEMDRIDRHKGTGREYVYYIKTD